MNTCMWSGQNVLSVSFLNCCEHFSNPARLYHFQEILFPLLADAYLQFYQTAQQTSTC